MCLRGTRVSCSLLCHLLRNAATCLSAARPQMGSFSPCVHYCQYMPKPCYPEPGGITTKTRVPWKKVLPGCSWIPGLTAHRQASWTKPAYHSWARPVCKPFSPSPKSFLLARLQKWSFRRGSCISGGERATWRATSQLGLGCDSPVAGQCLPQITIWQTSSGNFRFRENTEL